MNIKFSQPYKEASFIDEDKRTWYMRRDRRYTAVPHIRLACATFSIITLPVKQLMHYIIKDVETCTDDKPRAVISITDPDDYGVVHFDGLRLLTALEELDVLDDSSTNDHIPLVIDQNI